LEYITVIIFIVCLFESLSYMVVSLPVTHNGPAIKGGCVTWRSNRAVSWYFRQIIVPVQARYGACFCCHGIRFIGCRHGRGTIFIGGRVIVPVTDVRNRQWSSFAE